MPRYADLHEAPIKDPVLEDALLVEAVQSPYQLVEIAEHPVYGRQLVLDGDLQISESDAAYNVAMVAPLLRLDSVERVVILGGGDGGVLRELLHSFDQAGRPVQQATLVDIDQAVIDLSREHLPRLCGDAFEHPRAEVLVGDAFEYIADQRDLDAVIYDLTMDPVREEQPRPEFIAEILDKVEDSLRPGGVFSMQCCGVGLNNEADRADRQALLGEIRAAVDARFRGRIEQDVLVPSYEDLWTFLCAVKP